MRYLADSGHRATLFTYGAATDQLPDAAGAHAIVDLHSQLPGAVWITLPRRLAAALESNPVDVLLAILPMSSIAALRASRRSGTPVIIVEHGIPSLLWREQGLNGRLKSRSARRLYPRAQLAITVSHVVATDLRSSLSIPSDRIIVIPNVAVPPELSPGVAAAPSESHRRLKGEESSASRPVSLVMVGRLSREKNYALALQTARILADRGQLGDCMVIGDGPERAALEAQARTLSLHVHFPGWVEPWWTVAHPNHILLSTSSSESFGNVLVEAACRGIPSVALSSSLGVAEAMIPGVTGVLVPTNSPSDIADACQKAAAMTPVSAPPQWLARFQVEFVGPILLQALASITSRNQVTSSTARPRGGTPA